MKTFYLSSNRRVRVDVYTQQTKSKKQHCGWWHEHEIVATRARCSIIIVVAAK